MAIATICLFGHMRRDHLGDAAHNVLFGFLDRDANGVADCLTISAAVRDDTVATQAEQRGAADRFVVEPFAQAAKRRHEHRGADLGDQVASEQRLFNDRGEVGDHSLAGLEHHVPDEAVAHHDVGNVVKEILTFDVSDEVHGSQIEQLRSFERLLVAFGALLADREHGYSRIFHMKDGLRVRRTHDAELLQPFGAAVHVGT
jgi:hypothetical protein